MDLDMIEVNRIPASSVPFVDMSVFLQPGWQIRMIKDKKEGREFAVVLAPRREVKEEDARGPVLDE